LDTCGRDCKTPQDVPVSVEIETTSKHFPRNTPTFESFDEKEMERPIPMEDIDVTTDDNQDQYQVIYHRKQSKDKMG